MMMIYITNPYTCGCQWPTRRCNWDQSRERHGPKWRHHWSGNSRTLRSCFCQESEPKAQESTEWIAPPTRTLDPNPPSSPSSTSSCFDLISVIVEATYNIKVVKRKGEFIIGWLFQQETSDWWVGKRKGLMKLQNQVILIHSSFFFFLLAF